MKENSIEEDIEILESIVKVNNDFFKDIENQTINQNEIRAIEHMLSELDNSISKDIIKEKIKQLSERIKVLEELLGESEKEDV